MNYFRAERSVDSAGNSETIAGQQQGHLGMREVLLLRQRSRQSFTHSPAAPHSFGECLVHSPASLLSHSESSIEKSARYILGSRTESCDLVIMNRSRAVHRNVRDDTALEQVDQNWRDSRLHDVSAQHDDDSAAELVCVQDSCDYRLEVGRCENVGKSLEKRREGKIITRRRREFFGPNLVGATLDGNCANLRKIRFAIVIAPGR